LEFLNKYDDRLPRWWKEILLHILYGVYCGYKHNETQSVVLMFSAAIYQGYGWLRHKEKDGEGDTMRRDWRDYQIGYCIGIAIRKASSHSAK